MDLNADAVIPFPLELVYRTYRDRLVDLVPFLPNVRGIEVQSRQEEGPIAHIINIWHGGGDIPRAARAVLSEKMLSWTDDATWDERAWVCDWKITTHSFTEAVTCAGRNSFFPEGDGTRMEIRGALSIDGHKIRLVPGFLAKKVGRAAEDILIGKIRPNLLEVSSSLAKFLAQSGK